MKLKKHLQYKKKVNKKKIDKESRATTDRNNNFIKTIEFKFYRCPFRRNNTNSKYDLHFMYYGT